MSMNGLNNALIDVICDILQKELDDRVSDLVSDKLKKYAEDAVEDAVGDWDFSDQARDAVAKAVREVDIAGQIEEAVGPIDEQVEKATDHYLNDAVGWKELVRQSLGEIDWETQLRGLFGQPDVEKWFTKKIRNYLDEQDWQAQLYDAFRYWRAMPSDVTEGLSRFIRERVYEETKELREWLKILHTEREEAIKKRRGWFRTLLCLPKLAVQGLLKAFSD